LDKKIEIQRQEKKLGILIISIKMRCSFMIMSKKEAPSQKYAIQAQAFERSTSAKAFKKIMHE